MKAFAGCRTRFILAYYVESWRYMIHQSTMARIIHMAINTLPLSVHVTSSIIWSK